MVYDGKIKLTSDNVYIDGNGERYVQIRSVGYGLYAHLRDDGTYGYCGGCVGPEFGWKIKTPKEQTKEDREFKGQIKMAKLYTSI